MGERQPIVSRAIDRLMVEWQLGRGAAFQVNYDEARMGEEGVVEILKSELRKRDQKKIKVVALNEVLARGVKDSHQILDFLKREGETEVVYIFTGADGIDETQMASLFYGADLFQRNSEQLAYIKEREIYPLFLLSTAAQQRYLTTPAGNVRPLYSVRLMD